MSTHNTPKPNKAGKKWSDLDQCQLLDLVEADNTMEDIALKLERTIPAIKSRLLKETYDLINQGDWTVEELANRYKLSESEITKYQQREDEKKMNPPEKRETRSDTLKNQQNEETNENKRSFSSATKTRSVLIPAPKNTNVKEAIVTPQTYEEKSLALLTEIRDSLRIIAAKK